MDSIGSQRDKTEKKDLSREALDKLLACLDPDRDCAGEKFRTLFHKLVKFFEWKGSFYPEDLADATIDRVGRKLLEGANIQDIAHYGFGVARNVLRESWHTRKEDTSLENLSPAQTPQFKPQENQKSVSVKLEHERRLECLDECMRGLPANHHEVCMSYYQKVKKDKIEHRQELAKRLGVPVGTLRVQMHRIRSKLEKCVKNCLARARSQITDRNGISYPPYTL